MLSNKKEWSMSHLLSFIEHDDITNESLVITRTFARSQTGYSARSELL